MLTFEFTGVEGRMTGSEILTSGMVGKTVQILFDDSWTNLTKTLVIKHAGNESQFYLEDQLITKKSPGYVPSYLSIGSSGSSVPGALVESITIRKGA